MMKNLFIFCCVYFLFNHTLFSQPVTIGTTTYDYQTRSDNRKLMIAYPDGKISACWMGSISPSYAAPDRGSFYNSFNGISWGAFPTVREESIRAGYCELISMDGYEIIISHNAGDFSINVLKNTSIGNPVFTPTIGTNKAKALYPSVFCPQGTNDIYLVGLSDTSPQGLFFSRSLDGGNTWSVLNSLLPGIDTASGFDDIRGSCSQIVVFDNDVYILYGSYYHDLVLFHSPAQGAVGTWTKTVLLDFPIDNYSGKSGEISDVNGDGIGDKISTNDGHHCMNIDDEGIVHIWTGKAKLIDTDTAEGFTYNHESAGIWYWNSANPVIKTINTLIDWDNTDGLNDPYAGIGVATRLYDSVSFTSMSSTAIDIITGNVYLIYAMPIEYTDNFGDPSNEEAQSYRDLFGIYSTDNGVNWSTPVNLTNSATSSIENAHPSAYAQIINGKMHLVWLQDNEPGGIFDFPEDDVHPHNVVYQGFPVELFDGGLPTCATDIPPVGLYADPVGTTYAALHWDAVPLAEKYQVQIYKVSDPGEKIKKKPFINSVNVGGLLPGTDYAFKVKSFCPDGSSTAFSPAGFFTTSLRQGNFDPVVAVYPNPSVGVITIELECIAAEPIRVTVMNILGKVVFSNTFQNNATQFSDKIDISDHARGVYFIEIQHGNNIQMVSVTLQ